MLGHNKEKRSYEKPFFKQERYYNIFKKIVEDNIFEIYEIQQLVKKEQDLNLDFNNWTTKSKFILDLCNISNRIERVNMKNNFNYKFNTNLGSTVYFKLSNSDITWMTALTFWIE